MSVQPFITIYTQCYNGEAFIAQCIESVLKQTYQNYEYFICNHGSTDQTLQIMQSYAQKDARIHILNIPNSARGFYPEYILQHASNIISKIITVFPLLQSFFNKI